MRTHDRPLLLDLFCGQGGAGAGYAAAGFEVKGIDISPQPHYPYEFFRADALYYVRRYGVLFDAIHASPPCQGYSNAQRIRGNDHDRPITALRRELEGAGKPYVIENVEGARGDLRDPVMLCGAMFGLRTYRHRLFETSFKLTAPAHPQHVAKTTKMGRPVQDGEFMHVVGNFNGAALGREIMGMPWATRDGLREAIPPAYTEHVGRQLLAHLGLA